MDQADDVAELISMVKIISDDILIYSGYRIEELMARNDTNTDYILRESAVLIDGEYLEEMNNDIPLRGSSNQRVHIINPEYRGQYQEYFAETRNRIQNFTTADGIVSVGIHHRGFSR